MKKFIFAFLFLFSTIAVAEEIPMFEEGIESMDYYGKNLFTLHYDGFEIKYNQIDYLEIDCKTHSSEYIRLDGTDRIYIMKKALFNRVLEIHQNRGNNTFGSIEKLFKTYGMVLNIRQVRGRMVPNIMSNYTTPKFCSLLNQAEKMYDDLHKEAAGTPREIFGKFLGVKLGIYVNDWYRRFFN